MRNFNRSLKEPDFILHNHNTSPGRQILILVLQASSDWILNAYCPH